MTEQKRIFDKNIERVQSVCNLYATLKREERKDTSGYTLTDMLRAAVVLLHSSFEEYFRSIIIKWLPIKANDDTLKSIPISLYAGNKRVEKLYLNDLAKYRKKTIDEVIYESISHHMELKSFNSSDEITGWLDKIQIDYHLFDKFNLIDKAVKRRHKIVHEADTNRTDTKERITLIKQGDISAWIEAYVQLVNIIEQQVELWENENGQTDI